MQFCCRFLWLSGALCVMLAGCVTPADDERWRLVNEDGIYQFARGDYQSARDSFDYVLRMRPQDPVILYNLAQCYDRMGDVKKAEELYCYCLQLDAKYGDARLSLVMLRYRTGRVGDANQQIQDWLKLEPYSADALVADAWRMRQERAYPLALARLQQARSLDIHNRRAITEMALLYEVQGMPDRSLALYEEMLARDPNQIEIAERAEQMRARGVRLPVPK